MLSRRPTASPAPAAPDPSVTLSGVRPPPDNGTVTAVDRPARGAAPGATSPGSTPSPATTTTLPERSSSAPGAGGRIGEDIGVAGLRVVEDGAFVVEGEVARGGLGRVLLAHDARLDRRVALKEAL